MGLLFFNNNPFDFIGRIHTLPPIVFLDYIFIALYFCYGEFCESSISIGSKFLNALNE